MMNEITDKEKRGFADSLYELLMISPETGRRLGFWQGGNTADGKKIAIGIGDREGTEFWILEVGIKEASKSEVDAIRSYPVPGDQ